MADVPEIAIAAVNLLPACGDLNAVLLCVVQTIFARLQIPLPPRCNHFEFRRQRLICQLESNLVVAFSGAAMRERRRAFAERDFNLMFRNDGTRQRSPQQIFVLVDSASFECRKNVSCKEFLTQIFNYNLAGAGLVSLLDHRLNVVSLADVAYHGDHIVRIIFLEPGNDDGGIESSGIREYNFFRHGRSSHESGWLRRQAVEGGWPSARASGSPLDRKRLSAPSLSLRP